MGNKIAFIGAGSMAESIVSGIVKSGLMNKEHIFVTNKCDEDRLEKIRDRYMVTCLQDKKEALDAADMVILATKPYDIDEAVSSIKDYVRDDHVIVSVVAGIATDTILELLGKEVPVIRVMPNTSSAVGQSATAVSKGKFAQNSHVEEVKELFATMGTAVEVAEESMHAVTAVSGSGPAYFYYMVEAMEEAAIDVGLDRITARELIIQTVVGAGEMLRQSGETPATLRENVTSPGGTTQAGLEALKKQQYEEIIKNCIDQARNRSIELGKGMK